MSEKKPLLQRFWDDYIWNTDKRSYTFNDIVQSPGLYQSFTGKTSSAGVSVNERTALTLSSVFRAVNLLSENLGLLPWKVFKDSVDGKISGKDHYLYNKLHREPHPLITSNIFRETLMRHVLLWGNGYAKIHYNKNSSKIEYFEILDPNNVEIVENKGSLFYQIQSTGEMVSSEDMIHIPCITFDGYTGVSIISFARDSLGLGLAGQEYIGKLYKNGARPSGSLETDAKLDPKSREALRNSWKATYGSGGSNQGGVAVLEQGVKYKNITIPPKDLEYIATTKHNIGDVARWFGVPETLLGNLDRATHTNIEHQDLQFLKYTLNHWIRKIEMEFDRKCFRVEEYKYYNQMSVEGLLRADTSARSDFYSKLHQIGAITQNEIRAKENLPPIKGGDETYMQVQYAPVNLLKDIHTKNINTDGDTGKGAE